jgi:hypothetical protein
MTRPAHQGLPPHFAPLERPLVKSFALRLAASAALTATLVLAPALGAAAHGAITHNSVESGVVALSQNATLTSFSSPPIPGRAISITPSTLPDPVTTENTSITESPLTVDEQETVLRTMGIAAIIALVLGVGAVILLARHYDRRKARALHPQQSAEDQRLALHDLDKKHGHTHK